MSHIRDEKLATLKELLTASSTLGEGYREHLIRFAASLVSALELAHSTLRIHTKVDHDCEQDMLALWMLGDALSRLKN